MISTSGNVVTATGNGVITTFNFSFTTPAVSSDIQVYYTPVGGTASLLNPSQYTLIFNSPPVGATVPWPVGGSVTYPISGSPIVNGATLTIVRVLPLLQTTQIVNQGTNAPLVTEGGLDTLEMQIQQIQNEVARAPQVPINYTGATPVLQPPFTQGDVLTYDSNGNIVASASTGSGGGGGGVTNIGTGTGLTGGPITTTGTISIANSTANTLAGFNNSGAFSDVTVSTGLNLSGGVLTSTGAVTSVSNNDGTIAVSPSTGAVVVSLAALTSGRILVGSSGNLATARVVSGDGTLTNTGALTITSTNGVAFGTMATQNASAVNITGGTITGLPTPTSGSDAANKSYVDSTSAGFVYKGPSLLATTGSNLNSTYSNGTLGVGATLTNAGTLAAFSLDGVSPLINSVILVKDQTAAAQNGIYTLTTVGDGSTAWVLTRATNFNQASNISAGSYTIVTSGTINSGTIWVQSATGPFTLGSTAIVFTDLLFASVPITLTGDVTGTGTGTVATTIANSAITTAKIAANAVTNAKMATSSANTLAGYDNSGSFSDVILGAGLSLSSGTLSSTANVTSVSNVDSTLTISPTTGAVVASIATGGVGPTQLASNAVTTAKIAANAVTTAKMATSTANTLAGYDGSGNFNDITLNSNPNLVISSSTIGINATIYNVKDYGAKGDGSTNDNTAFTNCIAAAAASSKGGVVYIPQGVYVLTTQFATTIAANKSLYFKGDGPNLSTLQWTTSTGGIQITFPPSGSGNGKLSSGLIGAEGLTFYTATANGGNGLAVIASSGNPSPGPIKRIFNCCFVGDNSTSYWTNGILFDGASYTSVLDCKFGGISSSFTGVGIIYQNSQTFHAVDHFIGQTSFWSLATSVSATDKIEGIQAINCSFYGGTGINWNGGTSGLPILIIVGCDFDSTVYGVQTENIVQLIISDNVFYVESGATGIYVNNSLTYGTSDNNQICNNTFIGFSGANGIVLLNAQYNVVSGNRIDGVTTGIWLKSGSTNNIVKNNYVTNFTTAVLDQGAVDLVQSALRGYRALLYLTGALSISNATGTAVTWGAADYDPLALWDGFTKLIVPAGVTQVRISGGAVWTANSTGERIVSIQKNGAGFRGSGNDTRLAANPDTTTQTINSSIINVVAGDYFTFFVTQNSGGNLNLNAANGTWFSMEIIG